MKLVKVLIPFTDKVTGELHKADSEIELSEERIAEIKAVNANMVSVIGEVQEKPKKTSRKKTE